MANPFSWAIYLSIAVEIAALAALAGISAKFGKFIYIPFGIVTFIQLLGNFFFSYTWINPNSQDFKDWMDMIAPLLEPLGIEATDATSHRRILGFFTGGLLPFISLTFAHMLIVYSERESEVIGQQTQEPELTEEEKELIYEMSKVVGRKNYDDMNTSKQEPNEVLDDVVPEEEIVSSEEIIQEPNIEITDDFQKENQEEELIENDYTQKTKRLSYAKRG